MNAAYEKLVQHLDDNDVKYRSNSDTRSICADFQGEVATYRIVAAVDDEGDLFQVLGLAPIPMPAGSRPAIAEAIARANYGLRLGKFEMDCDDGELRFQIAHMLTAGVLDDEIIERMFGTVMALLDRYLPAFLSVIYGNETAKDAIRHVELPNLPEAE